MNQTFKEFVEKNKVQIGIVVLGVTIGVVYQYGYRRGLRRGIIAGFQGTLDWCDQNFTNTNLREQWNAWVDANPTKVVHY